MSNTEPCRIQKSVFSAIFSEKGSNSECSFNFDGSQVPTVTVDAINSIIAAAGRCGRPDVSVKILNEISPKYFLKPNERSYRSAIIACNQAEHEKRRHKYLLKRCFS